jgi:hypothetical protein
MAAVGDAATPRFAVVAQQRLRARAAAATAKGTKPAPAATADMALKMLMARHCPPLLPPVGQPLTAQHAPAAMDKTEELLTAWRYREYLEDHKPVHVCAVCACRVGAADVWEEAVPIQKLPGLELLSSDRVRHPPTKQHPRDALTTVEWPAGSGRGYCLSPAGVTSARPDGDPTLRVCERCHKKLKNGRVPPRSLVCIDTGPWPCDDVGPLPLMTQVEEALVAPVTVHSRVYIMRAAQDGTPFTLKKTLVGHVVVFPGPATSDLATLLPRSFATLTDKFMVRGGGGGDMAVAREGRGSVAATGRGR